jgi:Asp-tRNA(Asn)/Glu-tRNA(Gln) amidotransferase A subunit family amidase
MTSVVSVPMTPGAGGLPLGLQIAGRRFEDDLVMRVAAAWEPSPGFRIY